MNAYNAKISIVHVCCLCVQYWGCSIPHPLSFFIFLSARITGKVYEAPEIQTLSPFLTLSRYDQFTDKDAAGLGVLVVDCLSAEC